MELIAIISIFVLAVFVGFEVVSKVSSTLHTPLMSGANAIHGVILVGAIIVADHAEGGLEIGLATAAIVLATINMVGGFVVTDRMLEMFKGKGARGNSGAGGSGVGGSGVGGSGVGGSGVGGSGVGAGDKS